MEKVAEYTALINGILTLVIAAATVIYASLTYSILKEMRASRHISHRPRLIVLPPGPKEIALRLSKHSGMGFEWEISPLNSPTHSDDRDNQAFQFPRLQFGLKNIGTAPAINVRILTEVLSDQLYELVEIRDFFNSRNAKIENGWLKFEKGAYNLTNNPPIELPICVASPNTDGTIPVSLPYGSSFRFILNVFFKDTESIFLKNELGFRITVQYDDLDKQSYEVVFEVKPDFLSFTRDSSSAPFMGEASTNLSFKSRQC